MIEQKSNGGGHQPSFSVIGAGPGGLSIARALKQLGYRDVVVFEKSDDVGGKSWSVEHNGNTVISLRNFDLVVEVDPQGQVVWTFGPLVLKHQHCAWVLNSGNLLVSDNGNAWIIEVDRATQQIVWEYAGGLNFPTQGCAYRLPSGNTLITDSANLRVLDVTPEKQVAWMLKVETPGTAPLYRAWWSPAA